MRSLFAIVALVLATTVMAPSPVAAEAADCVAINVYFDEVDSAMATEVHALVTTPGWAEDARGASLILAQGGPTGEFPDSDMEPILDFLTIPAEVLSEIEEDAIPEEARPLHESAIGFWTTFPEWSKANFGGDPEAMTTTNDAMASYANDSADAVDAIDAACPGLLDDRLANIGHLDSLFDELDAKDGDPDLLANASLEEFEGIGVEFLIMPAGMAFIFEPLPPVAPVASSDADPATIPTPAD